MDRADLLNSLIRRRGFRRYLEVGVADPAGCFARVDCPHKVGVDPDPAAGAGPHGAAVVCATSDAYFDRCDETFDLVFVDGLHEEAQAAHDVAHALGRLAPGGVVVAHDCLPPDEWHQRPTRAFRPGEPWNGDVWKAALRQCAGGPWLAYVVDTDWGCAVIDTAAPRPTPVTPVPDRLDYGNDFPLLFPFVRTEAEFLADLYDVAVFYHVAGMGEWRAIAAEQLGLLGDVGLNRVTVSHVGPGSDLPELLAIAAGAGVDLDIAAHSERLEEYETPAMRLVERWAHDHPGGSALYLHTKGASAPGCAHKRRWRELMNREVIARWGENVRALDDYDVVGVNWLDWPPIAHFSGNFWWARGDWLRRLAPFDSYYRNPRFPASSPADLRLGCEFWIGSALVRPRVLSRVCANANFVAPGALDGLV